MENQIKSEALLFLLVNKHDGVYLLVPSSSSGGFVFREHHSAEPTTVCVQSRLPWAAIDFPALVVRFDSFVKHQ